VSRGTIRKAAVVACLFLLASATGSRADDYPLDPRVDVTHYRFALALSDDNDRIEGLASLSVRLAQPGVERVGLDLIGSENAGMRVSGVEVDGESARFDHRADRLTIALPPGPARTIEIAVRYAGIPADGLVIGRNRYGERTFFGDNYPDRARHWLPTVDHVADKATVEWIVTAPRHYQVVGNGALVEETDLADGRRLTHWSASTPMATKVMVIGVARFAVEHLAPVHGVPVQTWVYPQDRAPGFHDFALARGALDYFHHAIGPYPYAKLANVQSKTRYGGMENAGNIFYSENAVHGDRSNEGLIAHEIAHQWFGDSVSEADWHHVWLSEGFATYFTQLYLEHTYGAERLREGMRRARERVLGYAERAPDMAIVDEKFGMDGLLSANSYQKGAWVLHMLRRDVGDEAFWGGIRDYYARHRDGNALTGDLRQSMERAARRDLGWFFDQWVFRPGQPELAGWWSVDGRLLTVELHQRQAQPFRIAVPLRARLADGSTIDLQVALDGATETIDFDLPAPAVDVLLDPDAWLLYRDLGFQRR
jgi:aminopeptidase N